MPFSALVRDSYASPVAMSWPWLALRRKRNFGDVLVEVELAWHHVPLSS
jgi:hypothetical protein